MKIGARARRFSALISAWYQAQKRISFVRVALFVGLFGEHMTNQHVQGAIYTGPFHSLLNVSVAIGMCVALWTSAAGAEPQSAAVKSGASKKFVIASPKGKAPQVALQAASTSLSLAHTLIKVSHI